MTSKETGRFTFGVSSPSPFTFGVSGPLKDYKSNEWTVTRSTKDLDNFLRQNNDKPYDFRDNFYFTDIGGVQVAQSLENKDIFLFRGNPVFCNKLDFQMYLDKPIWLSNFKFAAAYATTSGSVIGYKISKKLNLFVLSNIDNIRALLDFYKDKDEDLKVIKFATGVDLKLDEHKRLFQEEFKGFFKWNETQNEEQHTIRRVGITSTDTKLLEKIKEFCETKGIYVDGYYSDELFTPMTTHPFHEEICLFAPKDRLKEDRSKSKCTFETSQDGTSWGGKKRQQRKTHKQPTKTKT
jgi:hypothetical protein